MDKSSNDKWEWTNGLTIEFIQLYESHPVLWDPKHKNHKNRNSLFRAWQNIAKEISVDVTVDALRRKKESLMATYRTLSKKVLGIHSTGSAVSDGYTPTWFAYDAIDRFIKASSKKIPSLGSEETHNEDLSEEEISLNDQDMLNDQENAEQIDNKSFVYEPRQDMDTIESGNGKRKFINFALPQSTTKKLKVGPSSIESNATKHLKQTCDVRTNVPSRYHTRQRESMQDELTLYGQLLAAKLRRLPKRTQLILQNKIDNIVFDAELNEIDNSHSTDHPSFISSNNYYCRIPSPTNSQISTSPTSVLSPESSQDA